MNTDLDTNWTVEDLAIICRGRLTCLDMVLDDRREASLMYECVVESYMVEQLEQQMLHDWAQREDDAELMAQHHDELYEEWWS